MRHGPLLVVVHVAACGTGGRTPTAPTRVEVDAAPVPAPRVDGTTPPARADEDAAGLDVAAAVLARARRGAAAICGYGQAGDEQLPVVVHLLGPIGGSREVDASVPWPATGGAPVLASEVALQASAEAHQQTQAYLGISVVLRGDEAEVIAGVEFAVPTSVELFPDACAYGELYELRGGSWQFVRRRMTIT